MASFLELIERARTMIVGIGIDPNQSVMIDGAPTTLEALLGHCARLEVLRRVKKGDDIQDAVQSHVIAITVGVGELPASVLKETWKTWTVRDRPRLSVVPYDRYIGYRFNGGVAVVGLDYLACIGRKLFFKESATASYTGNITLDAPTLPVLNSHSFPHSAVDSAADTISFLEGHTWQTGDEVYLSSDSSAPSLTALGSPITPSTKAYVIRSSETVIQLASTKANAYSLTADNITSIGLGTHTLASVYAASDSVADSVVLMAVAVMTGKMSVADLLAI